MIIRAGLAAGLIGGALDIVAAMTIYPALYPQATWIGVLQSVASGLVGVETARQGGFAMAALGLALHMMIALCAGLALAAAMARLSLSRRWWPLTGAGFGVAMYFFMQLAVLPLSRARSGLPDAEGLAVGIAIHILLFGVPMAFVARRLLSKG